MWKTVRRLVCASTLCAALAAPSAMASESRLVAFAFACDGSPKAINVTFTGLGTASTRFIQGAEISLFENHGGLQYIVVNVVNDPNRMLITMAGPNENHVYRDFTGFFSVPNTGGNIGGTITGSCQGGGQIQGFLKVDFFS
jgi:hypothetical protein